MSYYKHLELIVNDVIEEVSINIFGLNVNKLTYDSFLNYFEETINNNNKRTIAYANVNSLNLIYKNDELKNVYKSFDIIHHDGIGAYLGSKILYGKKGFESRMTGSDFYLKLIKLSIKFNWRIFFFGHDYDTLNKIKEAYPELNIAGIEEGFKFDNEDVIKKINFSKPNIIIIGLSCPKQEIWMQKNSHLLDYNIMLAVGDGIKVFANIKKRGPRIVRMIGLEWVVRLIFDPIRYWKRFVIGNPLFVFRIFKQKILLKI